jgi:hypothetical protein
MVQLRQSFDRKSVRKAVQRFTDSSTLVLASNARYHPIALALTSNTAFQGDAAAAVEKLCRFEARDAMALSRVVNIHFFLWNSSLLTCTFLTSNNSFRVS